MGNPAEYNQILRAMKIARENALEVAEQALTEELRARQELHVAAFIKSFRKRVKLVLTQRNIEALRRAWTESRVKGKQEDSR